jgi:hypothetical protein
MNCEYCKSENVKIDTRTNEFVCVDCASVQTERILDIKDSNVVLSIDKIEAKLNTQKRNENIRLRYLLNNKSIQYRNFYDINLNRKARILKTIQLLNFQQKITELVYFTFTKNIHLIKKHNDYSKLLCASIYVIQRNLLTYAILKQFKIAKISILMDFMRKIK